MSFLLLLFQDYVGIWTKVAEQGIAISVLFLILVFVLVLVYKILPSWERVRTADSNAREVQAKALGELASSISQLATTQGQMATTVREVAVEQRKATENVKILQRAAMDENNNLFQNVDAMFERMDVLEGTLEATLKELKK